MQVGHVNSVSLDTTDALEHATLGGTRHVASRNFSLDICCCVRHKDVSVRIVFPSVQLACVVQVEHTSGNFDIHALLFIIYDGSGLNPIFLKDGKNSGLRSLRIGGLQVALKVENREVAVFTGKSGFLRSNEYGLAAYGEFEITFARILI